MKSVLAGVRTQWHETKETFEGLDNFTRLRDFWKIWNIHFMGGMQHAVKNQTMKNKIKFSSQVWIFSRFYRMGDISNAKEQNNPSKQFSHRFDNDLAWHDNPRYIFQYLSYISKISRIILCEISQIHFHEILPLCVRNVMIFIYKLWSELSLYSHSLN